MLRTGNEVFDSEFYSVLLYFSHEAERLEQEARGRLERQRIEDEAAAEQARRNLLEIRVQLAALESSSQAKAEAESRAEANRISSQAAVEEAKLRAEALSIETVRTFAVTFSICFLYLQLRLKFVRIFVLVLL